MLDQVYFLKQTSPPNDTVTILYSKVENITYLNEIWHTELQKLNTMIFMGKLYQVTISVET